MKLSRIKFWISIKFWILYIPLYILLPCAIDVKCIESDARLNIWSFDFLDDSVPLDEKFKYNGTDVSRHFKCNRSDFRLFLKEIVKEAEELKKKNDADIKKKVSIEERGRTFNKRVLVVNRDQLKIVLEELGDILGCQECPTILFCDICDKDNIKNNIINNDKDIQEEKKIDAPSEEKDNSKSDSLFNKNFNITDKKKDSRGVKDKITDYNTLLKFCSKYLKNSKKEVDKEEINEQKLEFGKSSLSEIFDNDKKNFGIITEYYLNNNSGEIIKTLFDLKKWIIKDIETLLKLKEGSINDIETLLCKEVNSIKDEKIIEDKIKEANDKIKEATENIISLNGLKQSVLNFAAICEKYQKAENAILSLDSKNIDKPHDVLENYIRWRKILLQAQIIRTFIYFLGEENIVKKNEEIIKECTKQKMIPEDFEESYTDFFFNDNFKTANYNALIENMKENDAVKTAIALFDGFSFDSFLDLFWLYSKYNAIISPFLKDGIFSKLKDFLKELYEGTLFTKKKSVLFKIVNEAASNGTDFNENVFYKLDKQIKAHFNSIIFDYLTDLLVRVKKNFEDAVGKGTTYDFHNANKVFEIIRVISSYINPVLQKKKGRPELICNAIILLMKEMKDLSVPADINGILMECSLVLNTLIEYFIYVKDFNDYVSKINEDKQLDLKKNTISNKLDNLCIINEEEYKNLLSLDGSTPEIIKAVAQRLYEYREDEHRNNPFFKIVVMGNMRAGKTLLIRNLFNEEERFKFKVANGDTSTTSEVRSYIRTYDKTEKYIQITDTPGFESIAENDKGYQAISAKFNNLFNGDDTVVLDIVLFREGCINWLSENHKKTITRVLEETGNKIIFLIPFTSLKKNAKKIKEKFLASLFYNLYIKGKDFPVEEKELKENYKNFVERVIAIPINQLHSEENKESRFGLREMGETVMQCLSEKKKDDIFYDSFINSLPKDELCKEEDRIKKEEEKIDDPSIDKKDISESGFDDKIFTLNNKNNKSANSPIISLGKNIENNYNLGKEKLGSLKDLIRETLIGFNNFKLKTKDTKLIQSESLQLEIKDTEHIQSKALPKIDKKYSWYHDDKESYELLNCVCLLYLASSYFINQICKKSYDPLLYEIYKTESYRLAELIISPYFFNYLCLDNEKLNYNIFFFKEEIDLLNGKKELKNFLEKQKSLAQFCLVADDPFFISEDDYKSIQELCAKFNENYNNFNPLSRVKNAMEENYKQIKNKLENYFGGKEESIGERYLNFVVCYDTTQQRYIIDRTNLCFLGINLERDKNQYEIKPDSLKNYIKDLNEAIKGFKSYNDFEKTIKDKNKKGILYRRYHHPDREQLIRRIELNRIKEEEERIKKEKEKKRKKEEEKRKKRKTEEKKEELKIEEGEEQVINEEKEDKTIDQIEGDEIIGEEKNEGLFGTIFYGFKKFKNWYLNRPSNKSANNEDESPSSNKMAEVIKNNLEAWNKNKVINNKEKNNK